jgi:hypothetical protein
MTHIQWPRSWSEEIRAHFVGFVGSFIDEQFRARWKHILVTRPDKAKNELHRFEHHHDSRRCTRLSSAALASLLGTRMSDCKGMFFDGYELPEIKTGKQVADGLCTFAEDAIFSLVPGEQAVFISHDGFGWLCVGKKVQESSQGGK